MAVFKQIHKIPFVKNNKNKEMQVTDIRQFENRKQIRNKYASIFTNGMLGWTVGAAFLYQELSDLIFLRFPDDLLDLVNISMAILCLKIGHRQTMNMHSTSLLTEEAFIEWQERNDNYTHSRGM